MSHRYPLSLLFAAALTFVTACDSGHLEGSDDIAGMYADDDSKIAGDVQNALSALPNATVEAFADGVPTFVRGDLGPATASASLSASPEVPLSTIAPVFRLTAANLKLIRTETEASGRTHLRYQQLKNGTAVVGGDLVLHVANGRVYAANGTARDGVSLAATATISADAAISAAKADRALTGATVGAPRLTYIVSSRDQKLSYAYEIAVAGTRGQDPVMDLVYVNAKTGAVVDVHPTIHSALNRAVYSANNGTSLPGTLKRSEGGALSTDNVVNGNYDYLGQTYNCYKTLFNRDSYNNAGAQLKSTVHYDVNYVNAYWNGTQMVYGDGDGVQASSLALSYDVTTHELTHAVTENESNLTYSNESGALNEGMSDIFGAVCEAWTDGGANSNTWKVGETIWTPGTAGDALRYMNNPTQDGSSKDYYPERYTGISDNGGVHWNSGIANLAFYLLSEGGTHPRSKTTVVVPGQGITKAGAIFYRANTQYLTSSSNFAAARSATVQAATDLYDAATADAVNKAWDAVGVPGGSGGGGGGTPVALTNGVAKTGLSAATGSELYFTLSVPAGQTSLKFDTSGGTGDADLYVKFGSQPTTTSYDCRPYKSGNTENCTFTNPAAGTWYVTLRAYSSFSSVSLVGTYATTTDTTPALSNGVAVTNISGASSSQQYWKLDVPAGKTSLKFVTSGGTGDADMYVQFGTKPTTTSYQCRPYLTGNNETCSFTSPSAGTWYVMLRGYSSFSGVSLTGTHQ